MIAGIQQYSFTPFVNCFYTFDKNRTIMHSVEIVYIKQECIVLLFKINITTITNFRFSNEIN